MRRVVAEGPGVVGGHLVNVPGGPIPVGSPAWYAWLTTPGPDTRAFTFPAATAGELHRAYREWRAAGPGRSDELPYWYVRVRVGSQVRRFYLGPPAALDGARLVAVAGSIAAARAGGHFLL